MKRRNSGLTRGAGALLPISALPGEYGIGTLGKAAYSFVDFAKSCGFKYWQVLPVGPTSYGDSPYQSFSAFAGNPYFIDLQTLVDEGLLKSSSLKASKASFGLAEDEIDYSAIFQNRFNLLRKAYAASKHADTPEYADFLAHTADWLDGYALFIALKGHFNYVSWQEWKTDIKFRKASAVKRYEALLSDEIGFQKFLQFKFRQQWDRLKAYANAAGLAMIGDIPLYVAMDSADVWCHLDQFEIGEMGREINIAGVPPDYFSATGQRWGNPIYDWKAMEETGFEWWRSRMRVNAELYDCIRIDHFIGIVNYWSIPATCKTAIEGTWIKGPGEKLTNAIIESVGDAKVIAEDLGVLTKPVLDLIKKTGFPGMKILEFGLDGPADTVYLPHNFTSNNIVAYLGTHDNETLVGYLNGRSRKQLKWIKDYYGVRGSKDLPEAIIRSLYSCIADVVVIQLQDMLLLGNEARMNKPSTVGANWKWRMKQTDYDKIEAAGYKRLCEIYNR